MNKYSGAWENREDLVRDFEVEDHIIPSDDKILLADYQTPPYEGYCVVIFEKGGKLYEVNGSHCSCYGLGSDSYSGGHNTQWEPEETSWEALKIRPNDIIKAFLAEREIGHD